MPLLLLLLYVAPPPAPVKYLIRKIYRHFLARRKQVYACVCMRYACGIVEVFEHECVHACMYDYHVTVAIKPLVPFER